MRKRKNVQGELRFVGWGGKRRGAGRKPRSARSNVAHVSRDERSREFPAHVTLRLRAGIRSLREADLFAEVLIAITASAFGLFFRIVEFSVQKTHLHLIVEATDSISLTAGVRALSVRIASRINAHLGRKGPVLAERFHVHVIESPREARLVYLYVLGNGRKHALEAGKELPDDWIDPRSSGPWFRGWADADAALLRTDAKPVAHARTWLLNVGWRKYHRLISVREMPATPKAKKNANSG